MRVAFFSPLPPARSGIADYSEALIQSLKPLVELEVFSAASRAFDPARFDIALYHLGNNVYHDFVYETALRHPGVVVMHESNLHHLMADLTIKRGDWDAYIRECEYHGGPQARRVCRARAQAGSGSGLRRRAHDAAHPGAGPRPGGAQPLHAGGDARGRIHRAGGGDSARRVDSRGGPQRVPAPAGAGRDHPAGGGLRFPEALQADRRIPARLPPAGAAGAQCPDDPGGRAASRVPAGSR